MNLRYRVAPLKQRRSDLLRPTVWGSDPLLPRRIDCYISHPSTFSNVGKQSSKRLFPSKIRYILRCKKENYSTHVYRSS